MKVIAIAATTALLVLVGVVAYIAFEASRLPVGAAAPKDHPFVGARNDRLWDEADRVSRAALGMDPLTHLKSTTPNVHAVSLVVRATDGAALPAPVVQDCTTSYCSVIWSPARYADGRSGTYLFRIWCTPNRRHLEYPDCLRVALVWPGRTEQVRAVCGRVIRDKKGVEIPLYSNHWTGGPTVTPAGNPVADVGEPGSWTWLTMRVAKSAPGLAGLVITPRPDVMRTFLPRRAGENAVVVAGWTKGRATQAATKIMTIDRQGKTAKPVLGDGAAAGSWRAAWQVGGAEQGVTQ
jgi:hypothetical protein